MSEFDPHNRLSVEAHLRRHPLVTNKFTTLTPSMPEVLNTVMDAVMLYKKSVCFSALPQMGKTRTCSFCAATVESLDEYKDRFSMVLTVDPTKHESIIRNMANTLGIITKGVFKHNEKREEVLNLIDSRLRQKRGQHLVMFIDEAQALKISDFENLQYLQNALGMRNISMTMIGFAQTQIENVISLLRAQGRPELIVRFLNEVYDLPRCKNVQWVRTTAATYDGDLVYPPLSNCSYTRFFLPQAYDAGFRLSDYASEIFDALDKAASAHALPAIPTVHVLETFRFLLVRSRHKDGDNFALDGEKISSAINESQIANYSSYLKSSDIES
jgi:hypothetical protein